MKFHGWPPASRHVGHSRRRTGTRAGSGSANSEALLAIRRSQPLPRNTAPHPGHLNVISATAATPVATYALIVAPAKTTIGTEGRFGAMPQHQTPAC